MRSSQPFMRSFLAACLLAAAGAACATTPEAVDEAVAGLQAAYARAVIGGPAADLHQELIPAVLQRIKRSHATDVDLAAFAHAARKVLEAREPNSGEPGEVFKAAINAALRTVDAESRYLDPRTYGTERGDSSGTFTGLGIEVDSSGNSVRVTGVLPESPAARGGLLAGDLIVQVDGAPLDGLPIAEAISRLRGPAGTPVTLTLQRAGSDGEITVSLTRDTIRRQLVRWNMEGEALVLRLSSFSGPVTSMVTQAIADATAQHSPKAVVLDLRGNPGGLFREAVRLADAFLAQGDIVSVRSNSPERHRTWQADAQELLPGLPMVVLLDARSASASELLADALQANGRATVIGQRSYGKGSVQTTYPLGEDRGAIKLTTSLYHGPLGRTVHRVGVVPDIELLGTGSTARRNTGSSTEPAAMPELPRQPAARVEARQCAEPRAADPALSCALAYLRAEGLETFAARYAN